MNLEVDLVNLVMRDQPRLKSRIAARAKRMRSPSSNQNSSCLSISSAMIMNGQLEPRNALSNRGRDGEREGDSACRTRGQTAMKPHFEAFRSE